MHHQLQSKFYTIKNRGTHAHTRTHSVCDHAPSLALHKWTARSRRFTALTSHRSHHRNQGIPGIQVGVLPAYASYRAPNMRRSVYSSKRMRSLKNRHD